MPFTVFTWYGARRARKSLLELVRRELTDRPTLLAILEDKFTQENHVRPFQPLAERFGERLHVILCAEWDPPVRQLEGARLLRDLGASEEQIAGLLTDEGEVRRALLLRTRQPVALLDLYFVERGYSRDNGLVDGREPLFVEREERAAQELERLLTWPAPPPLLLAPPPSALALAAAIPGATVQGPPRDPLRAPPEPRPLPTSPPPRAAPRTQPPGRQAAAPPHEDEAPRRDRFELIELE
jgi:hypothetical protein